jgi:energy-coupling factor transporter ATP-binding protein EcfA2
MSINTFPKGSEWRKWDLHVHTPSSVLNNNQFPGSSPDEKWQNFYQALSEVQDVSVVGITDYFSIEGYLKIRNEVSFLNFDLLLPNVELRMLPVTAQERPINVHVLFNPRQEVIDALHSKFFGSLEYEYQEEKFKCLRDDLVRLGRKYQNDVSLAESEAYRVGVEQFKVSLKDLKRVFRDKVIKENSFVVVSNSNNDGNSGIQHSSLATTREEIYSFCDSIFSSNPNDRVYFLGEGTDNEKEIMRKYKSLKPCIHGSDSHDTDHICKPCIHRGEENHDCDNSSNCEMRYCWIKADPTFEGLKQIKYEPAERVSIGLLSPDRKSPDRVISKLVFENTSEFPQEIVFNNNLTSIIGSRSSGKSALLAYLAYAVDPDTAIQTKPEGPAAKIPWESIPLNVKVEWGNGLSQQGKVVYIPQNYLYRLSRKPEEITGMIKPVLFDKYPEIKQLYEKLMIDLSNTTNKSIKDDARDWVTKKGKINDLKLEIKDVGDKEAIQKVIDSFEKQIEDLKEKASLSEKDVKTYTELSQQVHAKRGKIKNIDEEIKTLSPFFTTDDKSENEEVIKFTARIDFEPTIQSLPDKLQTEITSNLPHWSTNLIAQLQEKVTSYKADLQTERSSLTTDVERLLSKNEDLISRCRQNAQLQDLIDKLDKQKAKKTKVEGLETRVGEEETKLKELSDRVKSTIDERLASLQELSEKFEDLDQSEEIIRFGVEVDFNPQQLEKLSARFNRKENSDFIESDSLKIGSIRLAPSSFMDAVYLATQKVLSGQDQHECLIDVLILTEEIRFKATMENDTIGGFSVSSMTEGKQALFALTLLLNKESDTWPLLIDQPEDDLDSRSIYTQIVPYLKEHKKRRQIIMVSHNANLVIGADSEQVIVANQHGDDRKNNNDQNFDYFSGSLEFTKELDEDNDIILQSCGIREHACDILDGGKSAFEKRRNKYSI